jgi:dTDP-4-dehydrorhamnose reductase
VSILVIGGDGLVGGAVASALAAKGRIVHRTTRRVSHKDSDIFLDLADPSLGSAPLPEVETAIFCAAVNGFARCRADPRHAYQVNVNATHVLTRRLATRGCRVIYLSSSAVFNFQRPRVQADDPVCPNTVYGKNKALAESAVLATDTRNTVVRLTKVLTLDTAHFRMWLNALKSRHRITAYSDLHFCPITAEHAAGAIVKIIDQGSGGIYQVSGADDISYARAARYLAKRMERDESLVLADTAASNGIPPEEVAAFTSLDISRFAALTGERAPSPFEVLDTVFNSLILPIAVTP